MSTLSQIGRGAVLLTSMALVACYIDVYTTGKFPWQHATAATHATTEDVETWSMSAQHTIHLGSAAAVLTAVYPEMKDHEMSELEIYFALSGGKSDVHGNRVVAQALYGTLNENTSAVQAAQHTTPVFLPGSKSDVAAGAAIVQTPADYGQATPTTPLFLSGTKSFTGQTTVLPGTLNPTPPTSTNTPEAKPLELGPYSRMFMSASKSSSAAPAIGIKPVLIFSPDALKPEQQIKVEQKPPAFMGGSKTLSLPPRLPEATTSSSTPAVPSEKLKFMGGSKSPGVMWTPGTPVPTTPSPPPLPIPQNAPPSTYPTTYPQAPSTDQQSFRPNVSPPQDKPPAYSVPTTNANAPNATPQFMSGFKSPGPAVMPSANLPSPPVQLPAQNSGLGNASPKVPQQAAPYQQQSKPSKITPPNAPVSPARSY